MKRLCLGFSVLVLTIFGSFNSAFAIKTTSTHYVVNEYDFGSGGLVNASSASYKANESLGAPFAGDSSSPDYQADAGFITPNEPFLSVVVTSSGLTSALGTLSSGAASTGTATFSVRAYTDSGYVIETMSNPPQNSNGEYLNNLTTPTASSPGSEQFGMNLVTNSTSCTNPAPANYGASPVNYPGNAYANGQAGPGYGTCGLYKYNKGDVIAQTMTNGWGQTNYTISYLANISTISRDGVYIMNQNLVAVATY
jgi:hypothetical protein